MRVFVACLAHETNTFASRRTTLADFESEGIRRSAQSRANPGLVLTMIDVLREAARKEGHTLVEGLAAVAPPGGLVVQAAYESLREELLSGLRAALPVQAVILLLHGAMTAEQCDDCEGDLIERVRAVVGTEVAIGVEVDLHGHFTERMRSQANVVVAFKEYPHTDTAERAKEVWRLTLDTAAGAIRPVIESAPCRMVGLWHTTTEPMRSFVRLMAEVERRPGVLSVSFGHGFPWTDVPGADAQVWVVADGDSNLARATAQELADGVWRLREAAVPPRIPLSEALDHVARLPAWGTPCVLADTSDNPGGGAMGDSSFVLAALLDRKLGGTLLGGLVDRETVDEALTRGVGAHFSVRVGGRHGSTSGAPVTAQAEVKAVSTSHQQTALGAKMHLGAACWLRLDGLVDVVLISARQQTLGTDLFSGLGIDWLSYRAVVVKSAQHFHAAFAPAAREVMYLGTPGLLSTDFAHLPYRRRSLHYWPRVSDPWAPTEAAS